MSFYHTSQRNACLVTCSGTGVCHDILLQTCSAIAPLVVRSCASSTQWDSKFTLVGACSIAFADMLDCMESCSKQQLRFKPSATAAACNLHRQTPTWSFQRLSRLSCLHLSQPPLMVQSYRANHNDSILQLCPGYAIALCTIYYIYIKPASDRFHGFGNKM